MKQGENGQSPTFWPTPASGPLQANLGHTGMPETRPNSLADLVGEGIAFKSFLNLAFCFFLLVPGHGRDL